VDEEKNPRPPSKLRQVRDKVLDAIDEMVETAHKLPAVERAQVLRDAAVGIAALETVQVQWTATVQATQRDRDR